jgi:hypothetical protein
LSKKPEDIRIEKVTGNPVLNIYFEDVRQGWEKWFLLSSDRHHDSIQCNRDLEIRHLEEARQRKAHILDFGDLFDAMQGKYDPRRSYPEMKKEYLQVMTDKKIGYLDAIVEEAVEFYSPYADMMALVSKGNHEVSISNHNDTDLLERFIFGINTKAGTQVYKGTYGGWVQFRFTMQGTQRQTIKLKYFHGSGGGGPVTKGTIQSNRQAVFLPDADIVVNGHIHESWTLSIPRERISEQGVIGQDIQTHLRTPTYKNDYGDGSGNWHVERGAPPKPMGCIWMRMWWERKAIRTQFIQDVE